MAGTVKSVLIKGDILALGWFCILLYSTRTCTVYVAGAMHCILIRGNVIISGTVLIMEFHCNTIRPSVNQQA